MRLVICFLFFCLRHDITLSIQTAMVSSVVGTTLRASHLRALLAVDSGIRPGASKYTLLSSFVLTLAVLTLTTWVCIYVRLDSLLRLSMSAAQVQSLVASTTMQRASLLSLVEARTTRRLERTYTHMCTWRCGCVELQGLVHFLFFSFIVINIFFSFVGISCASRRICALAQGKCRLWWQLKYGF